MLRCIPSIPTIDSIKAKLSLYKNLEETPALLELAIWKSINTKQLVFGRSNGNLTYDILKMRCCADSLTMVTIIVPNVLSFLTDAMMAMVLMLVMATATEMVIMKKKMMRITTTTKT